MEKKKVAKNNRVGKKRSATPGVDVKKMKETSADIFGKAVEALKAKHPGSMVQVNLLTDAAVMRAVAAWPNVPREISINGFESSDPWYMIWYAPAAWMGAARVPRMLEEGVMLTVKQNHLVYPDGTLPEHVELYLIENGRNLLGLPCGEGARYDPDAKKEESGGEGESKE